MYVVPVQAEIVVVDSAFHALGDVNWDGVIDDKDYALVQAAFGSVPGGSNWNPDADLNGDGKVDVRDTYMVAKNMGKTVPRYNAPNVVAVVAPGQVAITGKFKQQKLTWKGAARDSALTFVFTALGIFGRAIPR